MDICLSDSCLTLQFWQKNFCSDPNLSGLVKRSRQPIKVDKLEFWSGSASSWDARFDFVNAVFVEPPWFGSRSNEISTHGSYVVDVKPQDVHMTSDRNMPENTRWAIQQSPLPAQEKTQWLPCIPDHNQRLVIINQFLEHSSYLMAIFPHKWLMHQ